MILCASFGCGPDGADQHGGDFSRHPLVLGVGAKAHSASADHFVAEFAKNDAIGESPIPQSLLDGRPPITHHAMQYSALRPGERVVRVAGERVVRATWQTPDNGVVRVCVRAV